MAVLIPVRKGTRFHHQHKDSAPEWVVESIVAGDHCNCRVVSLDWKGETRVFRKDEIRHVLRLEQMFDSIDANRENFWDRQSLGTILHYHNSFGKFVRLEVVSGPKGKTGKPIALVGTWDRYELPHRRPNGDIHYPYSAKNVVEGELHRYPLDSIWEGDLSAHTRRLYGDPTRLPAIDLSVPEPTPSEARDIAAEKLIQEVQNLFANRRWTDGTPITPLETIFKARALLSQG